MSRRSTKWYRKNEEEVMERLGLEPTKNSGAGWVEKEDGQNDYLICQLKTTDAGSVSVKRKDLDILEYNAGVSHKIPVFALQFIGNTTENVWIMMKPEDIQQVSEYMKTGSCEKSVSQVDIDADINDRTIKKAMIQSGRRNRDLYERNLEKEREQKYGKRGKIKRCK